MKKKKMIVLICFLCLILIVAPISGFVYAYLVKQKEAQISTQVGQAKVLSVENYFQSQKIEFVANQTIDCPISINLSCNVDAVLRVKISTRYFDNFERLVSVPTNIYYNLDTSQGTWTSDGFDLCFYYDGSVKNIDKLNFMSSITCGSDESQLYDGLSMDFVIEVDVLQIAAVDYSNHPWKDNAPQEWIDKIKNL